ncbi:MAG TPA: transglutaminase [Xanthomonadaceae bacterium]|nr:transglutaminase [Xanthomonadaceae bacterium]
MLLLSLLVPASPARAQDAAERSPAPAKAQADNNYSFVRYRADYEVRADASSVETDTYEILLKTKSAVEHFSQVRLSYSEKMETLDVLEAYTITAEGLRQDVPSDKIYIQESYSSASAAMYADRKVKVVVFPNLAPGARIVYRTRRAQNTPYFPGYFSLWETFSVFSQYEDAVVTLVAPKSLPMHLSVRGVEGGTRASVKGEQARWEWRYRRAEPLRSQNWNAALWEFSPTIMASTYDSWSQMGLAYHVKGGQAAAVTPRIRQLADQVTEGVGDRRAQAAALYAWVARNIRYVAVYLGNGGLEPNSAESILDNHYGDCKDHTVILEALLAAKGIASTPVLIGAEGGPTLPPVPVLGRFNHAITYIPEFDLYVDSTNPYARFGQLPAGDLGAPVVHTQDGKVTRTPPNDGRVNRYVARAEYRFDRDGGLTGVTTLDSGQTGEVGLRAMFVQLNAQNRRRIEESIIAQSGFDGSGELVLQGDPLDLDAPFNYAYRFQATDYVDFSVVGGMTLPDMPGAESARGIYATASAETNQTPFYCNDSVREETYVLTFPDSIPVIAVPRSTQFRNAAGEYRVDWRRDGQTVTALHRLHRLAVRGAEAICQPGDYPAFRELFQQVRRGFRGQVLYGDLSQVQTAAPPAGTASSSTPP